MAMKTHMKPVEAGTMLIYQWSMVNGQWSMVNGQFEI